MGDKANETQDGAPTDGGPNASPNSEQTSSAEELTSTIDKDKTYSGADVTKMFSDWAAKEGRAALTRAETAEAETKRLTGSHADLTTRFETLSTQMEGILTSREDAERERVKDKPDELTVLNARLANAKEGRRLEGLDADVKRQQTAVTEGQTALAAQQASVNIKLAAVAGGVDEKDLARFVPDGDSTRLAEAVTILKRSAAPVLDEDGKVKVGTDGKEIPAALRTKPASALGTGTSGKSTARAMLDDVRK